VANKKRNFDQSAKHSARCRNGKSYTQSGSAMTDWAKNYKISWRKTSEFAKNIEKKNGRSLNG
jgi:hypothetical protein